MYINELGYVVRGKLYKAKLWTLKNGEEKEECAQGRGCIYSLVCGRGSQSSGLAVVGRIDSSRR